jgi:hypothetical protein
MCSILLAEVLGMNSIRARYLMGTIGLVLAGGGCRAAVAQAFDTKVLTDRITASAQSLPGAAPSNSNNTTQPASVAGVLRSLASRAAVVFVGQVESIEPNGGAMQIVFRVQHSVIGEVGDTYTLREWSGRWAAGQQHYRLGQRAMIFLYARSAAGFSSPVDGMSGVVPLISMGADEDPLLDIRMLATRVERSDSTPIADPESGAITLADAVAVVAGWNRELPLEPIKHPLPVGLRPHPVKTFSSDAGLPMILQQPRDPNREQ